MIETKLIHQSLQKEAYTGSYHGMRYYLTVQDNILKAYVYPEPFCFEKTAEEKKTCREFPYDEHAVQLAVDWLNEVYQERREEWERAARNKFHF